MLQNFYDAFNTDDERKIPKKVIRELNGDLPAGYSYVYDDNAGHLIVRPKGKTEHKITLNVDYQKNGIPTDIPRDKVFEYLYRTQKTIQITNPRFTDGNKEISFSDAAKDPLSDVVRVNEVGHHGTQSGNDKPTTYTMKLGDFPPPTMIKFTLFDGETLNIQFQRKPYESMTEWKMESIDFPALDIIWIIPDDGRKNITAKITVYPVKASSVHEAVTALKLYKSYYDGSLKINDSPLPQKSGEIGDHDIDSVLQFWDDLEKLEKLIKVTFQPGKLPKDSELNILIQLIRPLIYKEWTAYNAPFPKFHMSFKPGGIDEVEQMRTNKDVKFTLCQGPKKYHLMGAAFYLYDCYVFKQFKITKIERDKLPDEDGNMGAYLYIDGIRENEPWKLYHMCALTADEAKKKCQEFVEDKAESKTK